MMITELNEVLMCDVHGEFRPRMIGSGDVRIQIRTCPACKSADIAKTEKIERDAAMSERLKGFESRLKTAAIPARFVGKTLDSYVVESEAQALAVSVCREYVEGFAGHLKAGLGLMMLGRVGNGKNHLALGVAQALMQNGYMAAYTTLPDFIADMRAWQSDKEAASQKRVLELLRSPDVLILDEVGVGSCTATQQDDLFRLINTRYEQRRPMIILGNVTVKELSAFVGERAFDRLKQMTLRQIAFNWDSYRGREVDNDPK